MDNIEIVNYDGVDFVIIDKGNGEYTSMQKSVYDILPSNSADPVEAKKPTK
jgi:hypothetical protein